MLLIVFYLVLSALAANCETEGNKSNCDSGRCEMVGIVEVCTQCKTNGHVPIDGVCTPKNEADANCKKDGGSPLDQDAKICGQCAQGYFLHKGGCYAIGGNVGRIICNDPTPTLKGRNSVEGVCSACNSTSGFFKNPANVANKDSCIACDDTTGDSGNVGLEGCATCQHSGSGAATCLTCKDGYYDNNPSQDTVTCASCTDDCKTCIDTGNAKCTSCQTKYLKLRTLMVCLGNALMKTHANSQEPTFR